MERPVEDIVGYCYTCKSPFCKDCVLDHIGHETEKIKDFYEKNNISVHELVIQVEEKRKKRMIEIANMLKESPMEYSVALYIAGRENFLREKAHINCSIDEYCACDGADILFDIDSVMKQRLINVGQGVWLTEPLKVEKKLRTGEYIYASLSHQGILAIYAESNSKRRIQFTFTPWVLTLSHYA